MREKEKYRYAFLGGVDQSIRCTVEKDIKSWKHDIEKLDREKERYLDLLRTSKNVPVLDAEIESLIRAIHECDMPDDPHGAFKLTAKVEYNKAIDAFTLK